MATRPVGVLSYGPCKGQVTGSRRRAASKSMAGDQKGDQKRSRNRWTMGIQVTKMRICHPKSGWFILKMTQFGVLQDVSNTSPIPHHKANKTSKPECQKTWTWVDMENSWKFHEKICGKCSFYSWWVFESHGSGVEALQVDPDLVTYSAAVSSCEKAVRWKLALFLGWNLPFFFEPEQYGWFEWQIYNDIYIYLSDLSDLITKCTVGIHNPYEVEHAVWPD